MLGHAKLGNVGGESSADGIITCIKIINKGRAWAGEEPQQLRALVAPAEEQGLVLS